MRIARGLGWAVLTPCREDDNLFQVWGEGPFFSCQNARYSVDNTLPCPPFLGVITPRTERGGFFVSAGPGRSPIPPPHFHLLPPYPLLDRQLHGATQEDRR